MSTTDKSEPKGGTLAEAILNIPNTYGYDSAATAKTIFRKGLEAAAALVASQPPPQAEGNEIHSLKELVAHCWLHSGLEDCGYLQMTAQQRELYDSVVGRVKDPLGFTIADAPPEEIMRVPSGFGKPASPPAEA